MKTLIISDGKPGHVNQARALCGLMNWPSVEAVVDYPARPAKAAGYLFDWFGFYTTGHFRICHEADGNPVEFSPDIQVIVAVGSASYYPAKVLGRQWNIPVVALMYPRGFKTNFSHILCPAYDNPPQENNITTLPITLCGRDAAFYEKMTEDFGKRCAYTLPAVSVIIGGDNKYGKILSNKMNEQLTQIFELTPNHQHWVTTSRRTTEEVERIVQSFPFDYQLIFSKEQYNPIPAFITLSEYLFVTSDSASMLSECVSAGHAYVEVLKNTSKKTSKFDQFVNNLQTLGCVHIFDSTLGQANRKISLEDEIKAALADIVSGIEDGRTV